MNKQLLVKAEKPFYFFKGLLLCAFALLMINLDSRAQSGNSIAITGNEEWQIVKSNQDVKVYSKEFSCIDTENGFSMKKVLLKVENLTSDNLIVEWDKKLYYDNTCKNCEVNTPEYHVKIELSPEQKIESNCASDDKQTIFIEMIGRASEKLTSFEFINFTTSK